MKEVTTEQVTEDTDMAVRRANVVSADLIAVKNLSET